MWQTPKTDWHGETNSEGIYIGDRFNAHDFNRIKNNIEYLREIAISLYDEFDITMLGEDKTPRDYFYADEINALEQNIMTINDNTLKRQYGNAPYYKANGNTMDFAELNRLESMILDLYHKLMNQSQGRRMFIWNFGMKGGL